VAVDLSVKRVPDDVAERLRVRAKRNHRSLQGELLSILEEASGPRRTMTIQEVLEHGRRIGLRTPDESVQMIREDRDGR
jgi:plasmid stability protein